MKLIQFKLTKSQLMIYLNADHIEQIHPSMNTTLHLTQSIIRTTSKDLIEVEGNLEDIVSRLVKK